MEHNPTTEALSYVYSGFEISSVPETKPYPPARPYQILTLSAVAGSNSTSAGKKYEPVLSTNFSTMPLKLCPLGTPPAAQKGQSHSIGTVKVGTSICMDNFLDRYESSPLNFPSTP